MPEVPIPFGLQTSEGKYGPDGGSRLTNCYVEKVAEETGVNFVAYCRPGLKTFSAELGSGGFRGGIEFEDGGYVNTGTVLYRLDATGNRTQIGGLAGDGPSQFAKNQASPAQVAVVSDGNRGIISNDEFAKITDTDLPPPNGVVVIGSRFVFSIPNGQYYWTPVLDGDSIDALDFKTAEGNPDGLVGIQVRQNELVLPGEKTIEFHANTGSTEVFEKVPQSTLQLGCLSGPAMQSLSGVIIFPASDGTVRQLNGYSPERISTHDVERDIRKLADKSTLTAFTFSSDGHQYYVLNSGSWTWVCDLLYRLWFKWESYQKVRWRGQGAVDIGGKTIIGDSESTALYELDPETETEAGTHLVWEMISGPIARRRHETNSLGFKFIPGSGLNSSDEHIKNPKVSVAVSKDDGKTFGNERTKAVGKIGEFDKRVKMNGWGTSDESGHRVKLSMSAPVTRALVESKADIQVLAD